MAVALEGTVTTHAQNGSSGYSLNHTASGIDRLVLLVTCFRGAATPGYSSGVSYDGTPMLDFATAFGQTSNRGIDVRYLINPPTTTNAVVQAPTTTTGSLIVQIVSFSGVDQTTFFGTPSKGSQTANVQGSISKDTPAGGLFFRIVEANGQNTITQLSNTQAALISGGTGNTTYMTGATQYRTVDTAGVVDLSSTATQDGYHSGFTILPSSGSGPAGNVYRSIV